MSLKRLVSHSTPLRIELDFKGKTSLTFVFRPVNPWLDWLAMVRYLTCKYKVEHRESRPTTNLVIQEGYISKKTTNIKKSEKMIEVSRVLCEFIISLKQNSSFPPVLESHRHLFSRIKRLNDDL